MRESRGGRKVSRPSSLGGSPHSNVAVSRTHNTTHVPVITSPVRTPSPVITHTVRVCALRKRQRQRREQENERDRPTERPRGGLASLDRGTERKRVRQVRPMSAYTTCTQRYHRLRVVRALTHGYDWSSFTPDDPPIKQCFFFELARSLSLVERTNTNKLKP